MSPLDGIRYDERDTDLVRFVSSRIDEVVDRVCSEYLVAGPDQRQILRDALTEGDLYSLVTFARRSSVATLNMRSVEPARQGATALAMIDTARIDVRDVSWAAAVVHHALMRVGGRVHAGRILEEAARLASPGAGAQLRRFVDAPDDDLSTNWLMIEVNVAGSIGLAQHGHGTFTPTVALVDVALSVMRVVDSDSYMSGGMTIGDTVPEVWLRGESQTELAAILGQSVGIVGFRAQLRPEHSSGHPMSPFDQMFLAFVIETASPNDSRRLNQLWASARPRAFGSLFETRDRLAVLFIARSSVVGVEATESDETLARFKHPISQLLRTGG